MPFGRGLPPTVLKLGWISFFADVCSEMVYPLLPLFLKSTLGAPAAVLGLIEGFAEATVSFVKGWSGFHSDQSGVRVPYIRWGYALSAIGKPMIGVAAVWSLVLLARVTDRVGKGVRTTARDALIADAVEPQRRGEAFGFHRAMDTAGALVGVLFAAAFMAWMPGEYRAAFLWAGIPGFLAVALTFKLVEIRGKANSAPVRIPLRSILSRLSKSYYGALALSSLFALASTSDSFLLLRARDMGFTELQVVAIYAVYNFTYMIFSSPLGRLSDRVGRWKVMLPGWVIYALVYVGIALCQPGWMWALMGLYGVAIASNKGIGAALMADHSPPEWRGSAMGFFNMVTGVVTLVANVFTGWLYDGVGPRSAFLFAAICAVVGVILAPLILRRTPQKAIS